MRAPATKPSQPPENNNTHIALAIPACRAPAATYSLIVTAKMNCIDPRAWLAEALARIADHLANRIDELLPGHWKAQKAVAIAAAA